MDQTPPPSGHEVNDARATLEAAMFEIKRVIVGQEAMLERVFVALLSSGHLLSQGVPGLAKTLTVKTIPMSSAAASSASSSRQTSSRGPGGTRIYRPDSGSFDTRSGPVFCNLSSLTR